MSQLPTAPREQMGQVMEPTSKARAKGRKESEKGDKKGKARKGAAGKNA